MVLDLGLERDLPHKHQATTKNIELPIGPKYGLVDGFNPFEKY